MAQECGWHANRKCSWNKIEVKIMEYKALWPDHWPVEKLLARRDEIDTVNFDKQYQSKTLSEVGRSFIEQDIQDALSSREIIKADCSQLPDWKIVQGEDLAGGKSPRAAWTVNLTLGIDAVGLHHIVDIWRGRVSYPSIKKEATLGQYLLWKPSEIMVENNGLQNWLLEDLESSKEIYSELPIVAHRTGLNKSSLAEGLPMLATLIRNHRIVIPYGDAATKEKINPFLTELRNHPLGASTDIVMAWWFAELAYRDIREDTELKSMRISFFRKKPQKKPIVQISSLMTHY